jgi:hypothetical protein
VDGFALRTLTPTDSALVEDLRQRPKRVERGRAARPFAVHSGDEAGESSSDLVEPAAAEGGGRTTALAS